MRNRKVYSQALKELRGILYKKPVKAQVERLYNSDFNRIKNFYKKLSDHNLINLGKTKLKLKRSSFFYNAPKKNIRARGDIVDYISASKISGKPLVLDINTYKYAKSMRSKYRKNIDSMGIRITTIRPPNEFTRGSAKRLERAVKLLRSKQGKRYLKYKERQRIKRLKPRKFNLPEKKTIDRYRNYNKYFEKDLSDLFDQRKHGQTTNLRIVSRRKNPFKT